MARSAVERRTLKQTPGVCYCPRPERAMARSYIVTSSCIILYALTPFR